LARALTVFFAFSVQIRHIVSVARALRSDFFVRECRHFRTMLSSALAAALGCSLAGASGDALVGERLFFDGRFARVPAQVSCATCHPAEAARGRAIRFADTAERSAVPAREDGQLTTPRHASTLIGSGEVGG
jgi:cytochrome c peroxidase